MRARAEDWPLHWRGIILGDRRILAVVPARSGSKGIPHKNMRIVHGMTLIARAGALLSQLDFIDLALISTDSPEYAAEGRRHGLVAPVLRPPELSGDDAVVVDALQHALAAAEQHSDARFDIILVIEPTSPLRTADDLRAATELLMSSGADSVVTVSPLQPKAHPLKILNHANGRLRFFAEEGRSIANRQELSGEYFWRDGLCYALTRSCLIEKAGILTDNTVPLITRRPVVNIDEPLELVLAEHLLEQQESGKVSS
ncbi:MAG TPA: acylneuraminate cytidylyltransferase family protein [Longimicrobiales bacterium]|nr:acylneuraminate cytidylyltransferase family protein [Longimicrobiales bacterium]